jgi:glycosyltransferase involved in cell wall biosynthesis
LAGQVVFIGELNAQQLRDWYAAARVLVFPTCHHEGLPRILMECQSMGLPPVVYNSGGTSEGLLDGQTGFLVPPGDFGRMADTVETLVRNDALREIMSRGGRRFVEEHFSLQAMAVKHEDFYRQISDLRGTRK